jgi:molybdopterin converting factor small subunit
MSKGVEVRYFAAARASAGIDSENFPASTLASILAEMSASNPPLAQVIAQCSFLLDSVVVHDLNVFVNDGSVIDVLPKFAGG